MPLVLDHNLRNTRQIAQSFAPLAPASMLLRGGDGPEVEFVPVATADAIEAADDQVERLLEEGWEPKDVALLKLDNAKDLPVVTLDADAVAVGDAVVAAGNANGQGFVTANRGNVQALRTSISVRSASENDPPVRLRGLIQTNAPAWPGDSGGPMFDDENEVLGMTTAGSTREGTSYAVPIATALAVVEQVESGKDAGTVRVGPAGFLGIKVADADQRSAGKTITEVVADSPAAKAGVKAGSTLTRVGDTTIKASTNLATVIRALEPGQQVSIEWTASNGSQKEATVTLGSSPVN